MKKLCLILIFLISFYNCQIFPTCNGEFDTNGWCSNNHDTSRPHLFPDFEVDTPRSPIPFCENKTEELEIKCEGK
jgi:hypothetical protein